MSAIIYIFILFIILVYALLVMKDIETTTEITQEEHIIDMEPVIFDGCYLQSNIGKYLYESEYSLSSSGSVRGEFKIVKSPSHSSKCLLQSEKSGKYLMMNYTTQYNTEYPVGFYSDSQENNASLLRLIKCGNYHCIKFYNNYYLCMDMNGNAFSSRNKSKILFFKQC